MMNEQNQFSNVARELGRWDWRRRMRDGIIWTPRGILAGLIVALGIAITARFYPLVTNRVVAYWGIGLALLGGLMPLIFIFVRRRSLADQAFFADQQFGLKHRISTALEIQQAELEADMFGERQFADTVAVVGRVDGRLGLPFQWLWREWGLIAIGIMLLTTAVIVPNPQEEILLQQQLLQKELDTQIENLEALKEEILANPELSDAQKEELIAPLDKALEQLAGANSQEEGVAALSEATAELQALSEQYENQAAQPNLAQAGQKLSENQSTQSLGDALQSGNLAQAAQELSQLASEIGEMSPEEQAALSESLAQAAATVSESNPALAEQLQNASDALAAGNSQAAQEALQQAATEMAQTAQQTSEAQAAAQSAAQAANSTSSNQQQLAQAGQSQSGQAQSGQGENGEGQSGEGQGAGEQGVTSLQPGQGQGQGEGGQQGQGQSAGQQNGGEGGVGGTSQGGGHTDNVYVPPLVDLSGEGGIAVELPAECKANPALCGPLVNESPTEFGDESSMVPYNQVFADYQDAAGEALKSEYIPLGLKEFVKDYFSSLEP